MAYGPFGVLSIQGGLGVGKSKLIDVVVGRMGADGSGHRRPRFHRYYATADRRFDLHTLVELISEGSELEGGSSLVRLEQVLKQLTEPVIIAVNSAEHLLDDDQLWLVDPELADAFAMLNADPDHRVSVVLETSRGDVLAAEVSWPSDDTVAVGPLPQEDFLDLLRDMDPHDGKLRLERLSLDEQRTLYECADGIPRVGELLYATVRQAHIPLRMLLADLSASRHHPAAYLLGRLVGRMHQVDREVLQALAVLRTQVPGEAAQMLVNGAWHPDQVEQSLANLVDDHLVRSERGLFFLPSRRIHWKSTARTGALIVREHIDTTEPTSTVVLDTRAEVLDADAFDHAVEVAASFVDSVAKVGRPALLRIVGEAPSAAAAPGARSSLDRLALADRVADPDPLRLLDTIDRVPGGGSLAVVTGDGGGPALFARLADQRRRFTPVILVIVRGAHATTTADVARRPGMVVLTVRSGAEAATAWNRATGGGSQ